MRLISQDQVESLTMAGNPWPLALFTLTGGIAASLNSRQVWLMHRAETCFGPFSTR